MFFTKNSVTEWLICLTPLAGIIGAAFLAYYDKPGWGWFLFVACFVWFWKD